MFHPRSSAISSVKVSMMALKEHARTSTTTADQMSITAMNTGILTYPAARARTTVTVFDAVMKLPRPTS